MVEVEPHRPPREILRRDDPLLLELSRRQGEAGLVVAARDADCCGPTDPPGRLYGCTSGRTRPAARRPAKVDDGRVRKDLS